MTTISHVIVDPTTRFVLIIINHDRFVDLQCSREMPDVLIWRYLCDTLKWKKAIVLEVGYRHVFV